MLENYMTRPIQEKTTYYHKVKVIVSCEREILIPESANFDNAVFDEYDNITSDLSNFDYDFDIIGGDEITETF